VPESLPLHVLLSQTLGALTQEFEARGAGTFPVPSLPVWSNVLEPIGDGADVKALPERTRLSKRAVRAAVASVEKLGWVTLDGARVRLTADGEAAAATMRSMIDDVDAAWRERFGYGRVDALMAALPALVCQLYLEWPHYPAGYGPADDSITGGPYTAGGGQIDSKVPTHADDWAPVLRADIDGSSVAGLPLSAVLSQALMSFASDFEELWIGGLHHAATALRLLPDEGLPITEIPMLTRLPGNGKSVLERHGYIEIVRDPTNSKVKVAKPTGRGRNTRDEYAATIGRVEERWHPKYGDDVMTALRSSLDAIVVELDPELPHFVIGSLVRG
jgi:hypothetical protein